MVGSGTFTSFIIWCGLCRVCGSKLNSFWPNLEVMTSLRTIYKIHHYQNLNISLSLSLSPSLSLVVINILSPSLRNLCCLKTTVTKEYVLLECLTYEDMQPMLLGIPTRAYKLWIAPNKDETIINYTRNALCSSTWPQNQIHGAHLGKELIFRTVEFLSY